MSMLSVFDIDIGNQDIPLLAQFIYKHYPYDALGFEIDTIRTMMEFLPQLYPNQGASELERMRQILRLHAIIKFCQYAENLAAFAIAFLATYEDEKHEMVGILIRFPSTILVK